MYIHIYICTYAHYKYHHIHTNNHKQNRSKDTDINNLKLMHRHIFYPSLSSTSKFRKVSEKQASTYNTSSLPLQELGTRPAKYLLVNSPPLERNAGRTLILERDAKTRLPTTVNTTFEGKNKSPLQAQGDRSRSCTWC